MREAAQKMRNWGYAKARNGPRRRGGRVPFAGVWSLSEIMEGLTFGAVGAALSASVERACDQYTPYVKRGVKDEREAMPSRGVGFMPVRLIKCGINE